MRFIKTVVGQPVRAPGVPGPAIRIPDGKVTGQGRPLPPIPKR